MNQTTNTPTDVQSAAPETLSICIPTYNRARYLGEILAAIGRQISQDPGLGQDVAVYVSDNASPDDTAQVVQRAGRFIPRLSYSRNETNVGAENNFLKALSLARGQYAWVLGDDELLHDQGLNMVVQTLKVQPCGLLVLYDSHHAPKFERPATFSDYRAFAQYCVQADPYALVGHTLISSNVFRRDCFDVPIALENRAMFYPHMYGMIRPLSRKGLPVIVPKVPVISVREVDRPEAPEGHPPIDQAWWVYLEWIKKELELPELDPGEPSRIARRMMLREMFRNPLLFVWRNRRALRDPSVYRHVILRLFQPAARARPESP